jgi:predicted Abi (CAAX) family protease
MECRTVATYWMNFATIRMGALVATIPFSFARSFARGRHSRVSRFRFARPTLQHSVASQHTFLVPACGELFSFRHQLLRLPNGFRFLRIRACRNLSSSICAWHIFIVSHFRRARCSVLTIPARLTCSGLIALPNLRDLGRDGTPTVPFAAIPTVPRLRSAF